MPAASRVPTQAWPGKNAAKGHDQACKAILSKVQPPGRGSCWAGACLLLLRYVPLLLPGASLARHPRRLAAGGGNGRRPSYRDLFPGQLGPVLLRNPGFLELLDLPGLDLLQLLPLAPDLRAAGVPLLEEVPPLLERLLLARGDLRAQLLRVMHAHRLFLGLPLPLGTLLLHLHLDDSLEFVALVLRLLTKSPLLLCLLLLPGIRQLPVDGL
mmetsp:Transcript_43591/g.123362  ORF Transcript_43591/g.123362 Transcript_43591/m.123362 type:complete len:212 (+) Transcript_43591:48-683(+)